MVGRFWVLVMVGSLVKVGKIRTTNVARSNKSEFSTFARLATNIMLSVVIGFLLQKLLLHHS